MKFVFVSSMASYPWGGSEELWSQAATALSSKDHQVSAYVPSWPKLSPKMLALEQYGIRIETQPANTHMASRFWRKAVNSVSGRSAAYRWMMRQKTDLVCVSNGNYCDGLEYLEAALDCGIPYVSIVQANAECVWPGDEEAERVIRVYKNAARAYFVSEGNLRLLEAQLGVSLRNAEVVRNPFNVRWNAETEWPDSSKVWNFACVARLDPSAKGQDILLRVLAMDQWRNRPVRLSFFGAGPMERGLRRLSSELGIAEKVDFRGHVADVEEVWKTHHMLVLPSRYEGLPLALVEAMLCGRPSIVTNVAGNAELLSEGRTGFIAAAATVQHFAEAMERAWGDRARWQQIGEAARVDVRAGIPERPALVFAERLLGIAKGTRQRVEAESKVNTPLTIA